MIETHICPFLMRTVKFINGKCDSQDENCDDCPVLALRREKETE